MKTIFIINFFVLIITCNLLHAQCTNCSSNYPSGTASTTSSTLTTVTTCAYGGDYSYFSVTAGETYTWTTCGDSDFDTQLTLFQGTGCSGANLAYNDDDCGLQSTITWTATFTGTVTLLVSQYNCQTNSTCMTVQWACTSCGGGIPPCGSSPPAADLCDNATPICDLNGYCGNTSSTYTNTDHNGSVEWISPHSLSQFCGSIENNSWIQFTADATTATLDVYVSNCVNGDGIQMEIYTTNDCENYVSVSNCESPGVEQDITINATGLTIGQNYYVMIDGFAGDNCDYVVSAGSGVLTADAIVTETGNNTAIMCSGDCVHLSASGGTSYQWSPTTGLSNPNIANPVACPTSTTTYTVTVTGGNPLCPGQATADVTITVTSGFTVNTSYTNPTCNGVCNGTASVVSVAGGTAPYSYSWSNGASTQSVAGLCAGSYTVTITDASGCQQTANFTLVNPPPISLTMSSTSDNCGSCDGTASVTASGGSAPYSYSWTTGGSTSTVSGLCTGNYTVTVTDNNGCTASNNVNVGTTGTVNAQFTYNGNQCLSGNNYVFTNTGTTGAGVTFSWNFGDGNTSTNENPTHTYASAGTYTVTLTVTSGSCSDTYSQTVTVYGMPTVSISPTDASCFGFCDGSATANPAGGSGTYNYNWSNGQTTQTATGLCAGNYDLTVTDTYGCSVTNSVSIGEPAALVITVTRTDASCNGACDGTANASVSGGSGIYSYLWSNLATTPNISGLCAGTYTVTVTDAMSTPGCYQTASVVIVEPAAMVLSTSTTNASCGGSDGTASVSVTSGGTPGYTYLWDAAAGNQTTSTATGLSAGTYNVTVTDANGCTATTSASVNTNTGPSATITASTNISCFNACDGTATVTASGGTPGYTYSWSSGGTSANETGICAGTVSVTVTDVNGCSATDNITLTQPTQLTSSITATTDANCGQSNGSATVTASGGTPGYTYQWPASAGSQTTATANNIAAGSYTVTVTDAAGCTSTATATINDLSGVVASISGSSNVTCNGLCDGSATVTGSGGTAPYTYLWDAAAGSQGTATASGLCAGTYSVTVTDNNGCYSSTSVTITEPSVLTTTISASSNTLCNGSCDGSATVSASGGTPGYTYLWPGAQTTPTASGLCAGSYTVTVTDANGCTSTSNAIINQPSAVFPTTSTVDAHCGLPDGSATVTVSGGTPGYTYLWDAAAGNQNTATASNLAPGTYSVTVTDANGCTGTANATVGDQPGITTTISSYQNPTCNGVCDGTATVSTSGGTPPYTYLWSDGQTTVTATNLCAGSYNITVTDANGCTNTSHQDLVEPAALSILISTTDISCFGACDGQLSANVSGGTSPYTYQWDNGGLSVTQNITNLCAGTYCVTATDANGCTITDCKTITDPPQMVLSDSVVNASCGQPDGEIYLTVTGSTPASYIWSPGGATTQNLIGVSAGTYSVTVTDIRGCTETGVYTILDLSGPTISVTGTNDVTCNGVCDGSASVAGTGGNPPYTFTWSDAQSGMTATNLCAGNYFVTITDLNGCSASTSVTISEPPLLQISNIVGVNPDCNGSCNGSAQVVAVGGTPGYTYQWTGGTPAGGLNPTSAQTTGLCDGNFSVIVTDANGCTVTGNVNIVEPSFISLSTTTVDATCSGMNNGSATVFASGGTPIPGYLYQWDTNAGSQTTQTAVNLAPGTYTVTVTDANGCTETISATVNTPNPMYFSSVVSNDLTCYMSNDGDISVTVTGGTPGYTYSWTNATGTYSASTQNISNLAQDYYFLTVTDVNNCSIDTAIIINQPPDLQATLNANPENCYQACDGSISISIDPINIGTPPYTYMWSNLQTGSTATNLCDGTYYVTITDANGCTFSDYAVLDGPPELQLTIVSITDATCGQANGAAVLTHIGGTTGYTITWSNGWNALSQSGLAAGNYTVTVVDNNGCVTDTLITINNLGGPTITSVVGTDVTCYGAANGSAVLNYVESSPPAPPYSITWSNGVTGNTTITGLSGGTYYVTISDVNGCAASSSVTINEPTQLISAIVNHSDVTCYGACDGTATIQVGGGTPPYTQTWSNGQTSLQATNLCAGPVLVNITDANGCTTNNNVTITEPSDFVVNAVVDDASCYATCDGVISVNVQGGTPIYTYNWLPPANGTNSVVAGLCGNNNYVVVVTDANGCDTILTYYVDEPQPINIYTSSTPTTCGLLNGSAQIDSISGGTGNWMSSWTFNWSPGNYNTYQISNINNGNYTLQVWDVNGCTETTTVFVGDTPPPEAISLVENDILCPGGNDGSISVVQVNGGVAPYSYHWSSGHSTATASNLTAGTYFVTVTDADGCTISDFGTIDEPAPLSVYTDGPSQPICIGQFAQISATAAGGTPPYSYVWADSTITDSAQVQTVYPTSTTAYQVYVVDANNCISSPPANIIVNVYGPLLLDTSPDTIICEGTSIDLYAYGSGGNGGPYTYQWSAGTGSPVTVTPNSPTTYYVTVYDNCGTPPVSDQVFVDLSEAPNITSFTTDDGCAPLTVTFRPNVLNSSWTYNWNFDDGSSGIYNTSTDSVPYHTFNYSGTYNVTLTATNTNGCSTTLNDDVNVYEIPEAAFYATPQVVNVLNANVEFFDQSTPVSQWQWSFGDGATASGQNVEHDYDTAGVYTVQLIVQTQYGCSDSTTGTIEVKEAHTFYAPTAFCPFSPYQNRYFYPKGIGIDKEDYHLYIFYRWGELIFETDIYPEGTDKVNDVGNEAGGWNGRYMNTGDYVKVGTYTWYVTCKDVNGQQHEYVGAVTVIR